jgi:hypothetical protein
VALPYHFADWFYLKIQQQQVLGTEKSEWEHAHDRDGIAAA